MSKFITRSALTAVALTSLSVGMHVSAGEITTLTPETRHLFHRQPGGHHS